MAEQERTVGQLVAQAADDLSTIARAEVALAKAELAASARHGAAAGGLLGVAGYFGFLAVILLCIAAGYGLTEAGLRPWAAFAILGGALVLIGGILALIARSQLGKVRPPERAIASAQATLAAIRPGDPTPR